MTDTMQANARAMGKYCFIRQAAQSDKIASAHHQNFAEAKPIGQEWICYNSVTPADFTDFR
jgi:DNA gyrase inhibitor GyrI